MFVNGTATTAQIASAGVAYAAFRANIRSVLGVQNLRKSAAPPPLISGQPPVYNQSRVLFSTTFELDYASAPSIPGATGLSAFWTEQGIDSDVQSTTQIELFTLPSIQTDIRSFMASLQQQANDFEGQLNFNVNFNFLQARRRKNIGDYGF